MPIVARIAAPKSRGRRRLRSMSFFPSLITTMNLLCGFAAIYFSQRAMFPIEDVGSIPMSNIRILNMMFPSMLSFASGLIILGIFFDMFDGLVARVTRSTTDFGGQLDSLADMVNCGVAPAAVMIAFLMKSLQGDSMAPSPISENPYGRLSWACAAIYVAFAAVRLARFNVEHAQSDHDHRSFRGLPSPGAAGMMCAMILFHDQMASMAWSRYLVYAMPGVALFTGCLMVSNLRYKRLHGYLQGRKPFWQLVAVILLFAVFWSFKAPTLFAVISCYVLSGPVFYIYALIKKYFRHKSTEDHSDQQSDDDQHEAIRKPA